MSTRFKGLQDKQKELEQAIRRAAEREDVSEIVIVTRLIAYLKESKK